MFVESSDDEQIIERVAALDIGKAEVVCCVRLPAADGGRRVQEVSTHSTMVTSLCELANRLVGLGIERVVMEATSDYWRPPFYLFEAHGLDPWLVNAKDVKHLPGRPKTDRLDAVWLCKVAERQMLRPSFVPPSRHPPAAGPDPLPSRSGRGPDRGEAAGGQAARGCLPEAVGRGLGHLRGVGSGDDGGPDRRERDPKALAELARSRMRTKIGQLEEAFAGLRLGTFDGHHRFLLARMLARVDAVDADIAAVDTQIGEHLAPFGDAVARLDEIPGIGPTAAAIIIAEVGLDMSRFPTPAHLSSWAKFAPGINSSAGKTKGNGSTGHGNRYLARVLGEAAVVAGRTNTFLGARYRRLVRRRGKKKAIVAVGRSLLVIIWHLLADPGTHFYELGADFYDRHVNTTAKRRNHVRQLEALGYRVTLEPAA